jgi:hypothetical protein
MASRFVERHQNAHCDPSATTRVLWQAYSRTKPELDGVENWEERADAIPGALPEAVIAYDAEARYHGRHVDAASDRLVVARLSRLARPHNR